MTPRLLPYPGACIYIKNDTGTEHLTIIIATDGDTVVALSSVTSAHPGRQTDRACYLDTGDHPFIRHLSFVLYERAHLIDITKLQSGLDRGVIRIAETLQPDVLERVIAGALVSPRTPRESRDFIRKHRHADTP